MINFLRFLCFALVFSLASLVITDAATAQPLRIFAFGDSLTEGYGLNRNEAFPAMLQQRLHDHGYAVDIYNAGRSGDTTASGLQRLEQSLQHYPDPDLVLLALGANDMLRRRPTDEIEKNLIGLLQFFHARNIPVFLIGIKAHANPSPFYRWRLKRVYSKAAKKYAVGFVPDMLHEVALKSHLNLMDRIHPNQAGITVMIDHIAPALMPVLDKMDR